MSRLYPDRLNRDFNASDENDRLLSAYDKVIREQYMLDEDSTADAKGTLDAIIGSLEGSKGQVAVSMHKMALGMKKTYKKNKGFSKKQADWIYKTSKALFK